MNHRRSFLLRSLLVGVGVMGLALLTRGESPKSPTPPPNHILIKGGTYKPLYSREAVQRTVGGFYLGTHQVTNAEFLEFVKEHPEWQRSKVNRSMADINYLRHWAGDLDLGEKQATLGETPVVNISWFAAKAYCQAKGLRLPTQDEWEYTARADATRVDASLDPAFRERLLHWYSSPASSALAPVKTAPPNVYGIHGLHGAVWEWVLDFNSTILVGDSRGDGSLERNLFCGATSLLASDVSYYAAYMRYAFRNSLKGSYCVGSLSFRTARSVAVEKLPATATPAGTLYAVTGTWHDQTGTAKRLADLKGKVRILTMGFSRCPYACPRLLGDMQRIEKELGPEADKVTFVFLSIDPARDTPDRLAAVATERSMASNRWMLMTAEPSIVHEAAVALEFKYQQVEEDFAHSNLIAVINPEGQIIHRSETLLSDIKAITAAVHQALAVDPGS